MGSIKLNLTKNEAVTLSKYLLDVLVKTKSKFEECVEDNNKEGIRKYFKEYVELNSILTRIINERNKND